MVGLKRQIYGLPFFRSYRKSRAAKLGEHPVRTDKGFLFSSVPFFQSPGWERYERQTIGALLGEHDVFIDIGANHGFYSILAATRGLEVLAVEPEPGNLAVLRQNLDHNNLDLEIAAVALSDHEGEMSLYGDGDMASLKKSWQGVAGYFRQSVPVTTLDKLVDGRWAGKRILVKMDVEGVEHDVLRGAASTLARSPRPTWLVESYKTSPTGEECPGFTETFRTMFEAGYSATTVDEDPRPIAIDSLASWEHDRSRTSNFLFR